MQSSCDRTEFRDTYHSEAVLDPLRCHTKICHRQKWCRIMEYVEFSNMQAVVYSMLRGKYRYQKPY